MAVSLIYFYLSGSKLNPYHMSGNKFNLFYISDSKLNPYYKSGRKSILFMAVSKSIPFSIECL